MNERLCQRDGCNVSLVGRRINARYCSKRCYETAHRQRERDRYKKNNKQNHLKYYYKKTKKIVGKDDRKCKNVKCKNSLSGKKSNAMYCSIRCGVLDRKKPKEVKQIKCRYDECGKTFTKKRNEKYCSIECRVLNTKKSLSREKMLQYRERRKQKLLLIKNYKNCRNCKKTFIANNKHIFYCSDECREEKQKEQRIKYNARMVSSGIAAERARKYRYEKKDLINKKDREYWIKRPHKRREKNLRYINKMRHEAEFRALSAIATDITKKAASA